MKPFRNGIHPDGHIHRSPRTAALRGAPSDDACLARVTERTVHLRLLPLLEMPKAHGAALCQVLTYEMGASTRPRPHKY